MKSLPLTLSPLAAWLILTTALITLFPLRLEHLKIIFVFVTLLSLPWLPKKRLRSAPFLFFYVAFAIIALNIPLPIPSNWHLLAQLLTTLITWALLLTIPLSLFIYYLFRTAQTET